MIYDSVKDIVDSCDEMLSIVESGSERVDLQYAAKDLSSVLNRLKDEYAKEEDYNELKIKHLKEDCEQEAIKMEFCLQRINRNYLSRYNDRMLVAKVYNDLTDEINRQLGSGSKAELGTVLATHSMMSDIFEAAKHIRFELSEEDRELIGVVQNTLTQVAKSGSDE